MSAWYVLSALGIYPVMAGADFYGLASPIFEHAVVHLQKPYYSADTFVIKAPGSSAANKFIQSLTVNGQAWDKAWITHSAIRNGAELVFTLGAEANTAWASAPEAAPPSVCAAAALREEAKAPSPKKSRILPATGVSGGSSAFAFLLVSAAALLRRWSVAGRQPRSWWSGRRWRWNT
jgi:hypothetical protein